MANKPFDTTIIYPLERPLSSDLDSAQSQTYRTIRDLQATLFAHAIAGSAPDDRYQTSPRYGFIGDGLRVITPALGRDVTITQGVGFFAGTPAANINGVVGLNDLSTYTPVALSQAVTFTIAPDPAAGFARRDLVQVRINREVTDTTSRWRLNPSTQAFAPDNIGKTLTYDLGTTVTQVDPGDPKGVAPIEYVVGTPAAFANENSFLTIPAPSVSAGYVALGYINVTPTSPAIQGNHLVDVRPILFPNAAATNYISAILGGNGIDPGGIAFLVSSKVAPGVLYVGLDTIDPNVSNIFTLTLAIPDASVASASLFGQVLMPATPPPVTPSLIPPSFLPNDSWPRALDIVQLGPPVVLQADFTQSGVLNVGVGQTLIQFKFALAGIATINDGTGVTAWANVRDYKATIDSHLCNLFVHLAY